MLWRKPRSSRGRAGHGCDGGTSLAAECGTNMCGTNICLGEWELIQPSFPFNAIMDSSQLCKICDRGEGEEDQVGFRALILLL